MEHFKTYQSLGNLIREHEQRLRNFETLKGQCSGGNVGMNSRPWLGRPVVQVRSVRKASSGQAGQEGQLFRLGRSGRPVVQVRPVRKASCSG